MLWINWIFRISPWINVNISSDLGMLGIKKSNICWKHYMEIYIKDRDHKMMNVDYMLCLICMWCKFCVRSALCDPVRSPTNPVRSSQDIVTSGDLMCGVPISVHVCFWNKNCSVPEYLRQPQVQPSVPDEKTEGLTGGQGEFGEAWAEEAPKEWKLCSKTQLCFIRIKCYYSS